MQTIEYVFLGFLISKITGHMARRLNINDVTGYLATAILLGLTLGKGEYIRDLMLISNVAAIFVVFYAGVSSDLETIIENFKSSTMVSLLSVAFTMAFVLLAVTYIGFPLESAFIIALLLSNTATETVSMIIKGLPIHIRSILVSASFVDDLFMLFATSAYYTWYVTGNVSNVTLPILVSMALTILVFTLLSRRRGILKNMFIYMSRDIAFFTDIALLLLSLMLLVAYVSGVSPFIAAYLAGIFISGGIWIHDPMLRYRTRINDFTNILSTIIDGAFTPLFMLYVGLHITVSAINTLLFVLLLAIGLSVKTVVYFSFFKLRGEETFTSLVAGASMTGRGVLELTLLVKGFELGVVSLEIFNTVVAVALCTIIASIILVSLLSRRGFS
ncbi:cation:proton antiporter [Desulfurococcus amylolyticus]|uniref:Transporter, CPA2 family n=1 Tax=Desulfurococcus amylolyticus DSM 16532 TaxID=768672 RepID=I3XQF4_DESAM|nr:cation:proton antiporter [Desulfurococcus amylolyticus]AFL66178.1 transporter, CPA2 family [Desulfurococcus amylolyticus DSM 16532]